MLLAIADIAYCPFLSSVLRDLLKKSYIFQEKKVSSMEVCDSYRS